MLDSTKEYGVGKLFAICFKPQIKRGVCINCRPRSSFLLPLKGKITYTFNNKYLEVCENELLYLPKNSNYIYDSDYENSEYLQIEFDLFESENGVKKDVILSQTPCKKAVHDKKIILHFRNVINGYNSEILEYKSKAISSLYEIIAYFSLEESEKQIHRISKALKYIEDNKFNDIYVNDLASLSNMSSAQFRRVFKESMGCTPVKYKNNLLINLACEILNNGNFTIGEVASALNFDDVYGFSKFFKREMGVSPSEYKKANR